MLTKYENLLQLCKEQNVPLDVYNVLAEYLDNGKYEKEKDLHYGYWGTFESLEELAKVIIFERLGGLPVWAMEFFDYSAFICDQKEQYNLLWASHEGILYVFSVYFSGYLDRWTKS